MGIVQKIRRCLTLKCPACGKASIIERPFRIAQACPSCGVVFKREEGFFVGAILISVVTTELVILVASFLSFIVLRLEPQLSITLLFVIALIFPPAFYHHSWSIWLSVNHAVEKLRKID